MSGIFNNSTTEELELNLEDVDENIFESDDINDDFMDDEDIDECEESFEMDDDDIFGESNDCYEPDEDTIDEVEESMFGNDAFDLYSTVVDEADDASVENISDYEKARSELFDDENLPDDVEDMMDSQIGGGMVVPDELDILGVNTDDFICIDDKDL